MGLIAGVLFLIGIGLVVAKRRTAGMLVLFVAGLFGWGVLMRSS